MWKKTLSITLALIAVAVLASWAQPPDFPSFGGEEGSRFEHWQEGRMARMVEYLELSESQTAEWRAILRSHSATAPDRLEVFKSADTWREEFRVLAAEENPDLEQLGQLALDIHRAHEFVRTSRQQLVSELQTILTPEQAEKLEALEAARDFSAPRGRQGPRHRRPSPDTD